jgi:O-antigen ligase
MTGTVILFAIFSTLMVLSVLNRRWLMLAILLVGGFPVTIFMPQDNFFGLHAGGAYLTIILSALFLSFLFAIPNFFAQSFRYGFFLAFITYCLLSLSWTPDIGWGLRMLVKLASPFMFFIAMQAFFKEDLDLKTAERMITVCCLIVSALAVVNTVGGGVLAKGEDMFNVRNNYLTAPFMSPANYSFLIGSGAILALCNLLQTRKVSHFLLFMLLSVFVFWAFVRISMVGLIAAIAVVFFLHTRNVAIKFMIPLTIVLIFVVCFFTVDKFRARMFKSDKVSLETVMGTDLNKIDKLIYTSGRTQLWRKVNTEFFHKAPLVGMGIGSVDYWLERNFKGRLHSEYLRILSDTGLVGLCLYLLSILQFYARLVGLYLRSKDPDVQKYTAMALAGLTFYLITLATDNSFNYISEFGLYIFTFMAFAFVSERTREEQKKTALLNSPGDAARAGSCHDLASPFFSSSSA